MRKKMWKNWCCLGMAGVLAVGGMTGCGSKKMKNSTDLTERVKETERVEKDTTTEEEDVNTGVSELFRKDTTDFAVALLQETMQQEQQNTNVMVSPVSVLEALAMTANGARGETAEQMQAILGANQTREELNTNVRNWNALHDTDDTTNIANAIWFREGAFEVSQDFLNQNTDYYGAGIYASDFSEKTVKDINQWVKEKTDKKIDKIITELPQQSLMCLVNAVSFDAKWSEPYESEDVWEEMFTLESGERKDMEMMHSQENYYLEDGQAVGVRKPYKNGYSFVAVLPKEETTVEDYVSNLTGEAWAELLDSEQAEEVTTVIPKFKAEYSTSLKDTLVQMGMPLAFDAGEADFTGMDASGDHGICIGDVLHKTYIEVDEQGTKAAATTAVVALETAMEAEPKEVILDRSFVYAIVEDETEIPLFFGVYCGE